MKPSLFTALLMSLWIFCSALAAEHTDDNALPLLQESRQLMKDGKNQEALAGFERALQYHLSPEHESYALVCMGSLLYETDKEKCIENLKKARQLDPKNESVLPLLGSAYARKGELENAKEALNAYLAAKPDGDSVGDVKKLLENIKGIEAEGELVKKINEAVRLYNDKKYADAVAILEETQKQEHKHKKTETEILALSYEGQGKYPVAIEMFKKMLEEDPKQPKIVSALASAYEGIGDLQQSRATLKQYLHMEKKGDVAKAAKDRLPALKRVIKTAGDSEGNDYFKAVSNKYISRWSMTRMPLKVYIEPPTGVANYAPEFDKYVPDAFDMWCHATGGKVSWALTDDKTRADIYVLWTADPSVVGMTESKSEAGICETKLLGLYGAKIMAVNQASVKLLTTDTHAKPFQSKEVFATTVHEIGHALGLREHSSNPSDMMFFATTGNVRDTLSDRDVATISAVYKAKVYSDGRVVVADESDQGKGVQP